MNSLSDFRHKRTMRDLRKDVVVHINSNPRLIEVIAKQFNIEPYYMKKVTDGKSLLFVMDKERQEDGSFLSSEDNLNKILCL